MYYTDCDIFDIIHVLIIILKFFIIMNLYSINKQLSSFDVKVGFLKRHLIYCVFIFLYTSRNTYYVSGILCYSLTYYIIINLLINYIIVNVIMYKVGEMSSRSRIQVSLVFN